ncbi:MAG: hypothetical protein ABI304_00640 [Rudaea sp.]
MVPQALDRDPVEIGITDQVQLPITVVVGNCRRCGGANGTRIRVNGEDPVEQSSID